MESKSFTTDGVRGLPSVSWCELNVIGVVLSALSEFDSSRSIIVGYDGRAGSRELAAYAAAVVERSGREYMLCGSPAATPALGRYCFDTEHVAGAIAMTASHNPPGYVGVKLRGSAGQALPRPDAPISDESGFLEDLAARLPQLRWTDEPNNKYRRATVTRLDKYAERFEGNVHFDSMYGATSGYRVSASSVRWHRATTWPFFLGLIPDPVWESSHRTHPPAASTLDDEDIYFCTDGDGDRICAYTKASGYVTATELALCFIELGGLGQVISTVAASRSLVSAANRHGFDYVDTSVGFRHIADRWVRDGKQAVVGVEPNGGLVVASGVGEYFERDGLWTAGTVLAAFPDVTSLDDAVADVRMQRKYRDMQLSFRISYDTLVDSFMSGHPDFEAVERLNALELLGPLDQRVLVRESGTENMTRVYVETNESVGEWFRQLVRQES